MNKKSSVLLATLVLAVTLASSTAGPGSDGRFLSYLGGSGGEVATAVATDGSGAIFVAGTTSSADLPVKNALAATLAGGSDAFVAKLAPNGATVLWATYLGGSGDDRATAIAVDAAGN